MLLLMHKDKIQLLLAVCFLKITRQSYMNLVPYGIEIFYITRINIILMFLEIGFFRYFLIMKEKIGYGGWWFLPLI